MRFSIDEWMVLRHAFPQGGGLADQIIVIAGLGTKKR
jgi:hypothetical protein